MHENEHDTSTVQCRFEPLFEADFEAICASIEMKLSTDRFQTRVVMIGDVRNV